MKEKKLKVVSGGNGRGNNDNQLCSPWGIFLDKIDNLFVADTGNHRIMRYLKNETIGKIVAGGEYGDSCYQLK